MGSDRPIDGTYSSRFDSGRRFLTLLTERTRATMADPRSIQHPERAIALWSPFLRIEGAACWTAERPIRLESEIGAGKSFGVRWMCPLRRSIDDGGWFRGSKDWIRHRLHRLHRLTHRYRSKFRRAHRRGMQRMSQFEPDIPDPLSENEPELLAPGRVRTPAVGVLFFVFISEHGLKRSAMQVESYHISRSKRLLRQSRVEQFVD